MSAQMPKSRLKHLMFGLLASSLSLVAIGLVEGVLRIANVGESARSVFVAVPGRPEYLALNPDYVRRYFRAFDPGVAFNPFLSAKPDSSFRVFVLGGSTTAGFPYRFYHGFPGTIERQLRAEMFGRTVEVINLGMSAVNSYTVLDLAEAASDHAPDALVIYAGHNEYYGAFGTGSTEGRFGDLQWLKRLVIGLRHTTLFTLLETGVERISPRPQASSRTLMAEVVQNSDIEKDTPVFENGIRQFDANLSRVLAMARDREIPVFIATLTSNLFGQRPLTDGPAAHSAYDRGVAFLSSGDTVSARGSFLEAKELDGLRFRAPEAINDVIRKRAPESGAHLVDIEKLFRSKSPSGLEDDRLFSDHLHPNTVGYALMGQAFVDDMRAVLRWTPRLAAGPARPIDRIDSSYSALMIERLLTDYPFNKSDSPDQIAKRNRERLERALREGDAADSLAAQIVTGRLDFPEATLQHAERSAASGDTTNALRSYLSVLAWQPFNHRLMTQIIDFGLGTSRFDDDLDPILLWAATHHPEALTLAALGAVRLRDGRLDDAAVVLSAAERLTPDDASVLFNLARVNVLRGDTLLARSYFERYVASR